MSSYEHPWQQGPAEMIKNAIRLIDEEDLDNSFNNRVSFLMIDAGVEILLKVFISLPSDVTGLHNDEEEPEPKMQDNFPRLIKFIKENVGNRLSGISLDDVQYFHSNIRNKLYHGGGGVTVSTQTVRRYADLAVKLLDILLDVKLDIESSYKEEYEKVEEAQSALRKELETCIEQLIPAILLPNFRNKINSINVYDPLKSLWDLSKLIEETFSVDFNSCFSEADIGKINYHLAETCGTDVTNYLSKKDIAFQVYSGLLGWELLTINNLPVGKYKVNSLAVNDFIKFHEFDKGNYINVYLKIVCEIIDIEVLGGRYKKSLNKLMDIAEDCHFLIGPYYYFGEYDHGKMTNSLSYLQDSIKAWREECLECRNKQSFITSLMKYCSKRIKLRR